MKKLLIVNDNLELGGIQKSLINLLQELKQEYEISLLLLYKSGPLLAKVPEEVRVIAANKMFGVVGATRKALRKNKLGYVWKGFLCVLANKISKKFAIKFAGIFQKKVSGYDAVISFSHASKENSLVSCCAEFVLDKTVAKEKICFIHCDYSNENNRCTYTDTLYSSFSRIACCSESVKNRFLTVLPELKDRTYAVRNFYDMSFGIDRECTFYEYDCQYINLVTVARMTEEKGIGRALRALCESERKDIRYYIVGDGPERKYLESFICKNGLEDRVVLFGTTERPEEYMRNADYLLVPSLHEAAPMVFDEAKMLGVKVIATDTTSAREMLGDGDGVVCENSEMALIQVLRGITKPDKIGTNGKTYTNELQRKQFASLMEEI